MFWRVKSSLVEVPPVNHYYKLLNHGARGRETPRMFGRELLELLGWGDDHPSPLRALVVDELAG
eukprot:6041032-Pyramimonas_sp.AAC.1